MISIVRYSENDYYTKKISSICNARIIWGGDNSINNIRKFPLSHRSLDIAFADRYSFCLINSDSICELNEFEFRNLLQSELNNNRPIS